MRHGLARLPDGTRKAALRSLADELFTAFADRVLPFDAAAAAAHAELTADRERAGNPLNGFDAQIAGVCRSRRLTLATRNGKDFLGTGVELVDPWRPAAR